MSTRRADVSVVYHNRLMKLGQKMLDAHCNGWKFAIDFDGDDVQSADQIMLGCPGRNGSTQFASRTVSIDFGMLERRCTENEIVDVVLHEIAHVLAGKRAGHGKRWIEAARQIGVSEKNWTRNLMQTIMLTRLRREARSNTRKRRFMSPPPDL